MRLEVGVSSTVELVAAALCKDVDYTPEGFAILRFESSRLYLHFLDEIEIYATAERAKVERVRSESAVSGIRYVRAVDDVFILQAGSTIDGWIGNTSSAAIGNARSKKNDGRDAATGRYVLVQRLVEVRPHP